MDFFFHAHFIDWQWYDVQWDIVRGVIPSICGHFQYGGGLTARVITSWKQAKATRIYQSVLRPDGRHHQDLVITHISRFQTGMLNLRLVLPPCLQDQHIALKAKGQNRRGQRDVVDPASVSNLSLLLDLLWPLGLWGPYMCTCGTKGGHSFGPVSCAGPQIGLRVTRDFRSGIKQFFWAEMLMEPGLFEFYKETSRLLAIGAFKQKIR